MNSFDYLQCEDVYPECDYDFWMDEEDWIWSRHLRKLGFQPFTLSNPGQHRAGSPLRYLQYTDRATAADTPKDWHLLVQVGEIVWQKACQSDLPFVASSPRSVRIEQYQIVHKNFDYKRNWESYKTNSYRIIWPHRLCWLGYQPLTLERTDRYGLGSPFQEFSFWKPMLVG